MQAEPHPGDVVGAVNLARGAENAELLFFLYGFASP
jgi:hypothetical protein